MKHLLLAIFISLFALIHGFSSAAELQVVTVALVSPSWNTGLPTAVARGAGFFKEGGLDVRPVTLSSSGPIMMALLMRASGHSDCRRGCHLTWHPPRRSRGGRERPPRQNKLRSHERQGIKDRGGLEGKDDRHFGDRRYGRVYGGRILRRKGLVKDRDFSILNIEGGPAARMAALKTGKVDAVPFTPGQRVQAENDGFTVLLDTREILTEIPSTIVASTRNFVSSNPDKMVGFLRALDRAMIYIRQDREKAMALGVKHGLRGDMAIERKALDYYVEDLDIRLNRDNIKALLKQIEVSDGPQKYFDDTYLTRAIGLR